MPFTLRQPCALLLTKPRGRSMAARPHVIPPSRRPADRRSSAKAALSSTKTAMTVPAPSRPHADLVGKSPGPSIAAYNRRRHPTTTCGNDGRSTANTDPQQYPLQSLPVLHRHARPCEREGLGLSGPRQVREQVPRTSRTQRPHNETPRQFGSRTRQATRGPGSTRRCGANRTRMTLYRCLRTAIRACLPGPSPLYPRPCLRVRACMGMPGRDCLPFSPDPGRQARTRRRPKCPR
jgi:hypothetical protein